MYYVYIIEASDGTYYTGVTKDLKRRFKQHSEGKGAKYLRGSRSPVKYVYSKFIGDIGLALEMERKIKKMSRKKKENLVNGVAELNMYRLD